jgi:purine-nucleoside phosphorylase
MSEQHSHQAAMPQPARQQASEAALSVQRRFQPIPRVGLILGSGLGGLAESVSDATVIPYTDIPHFPAVTVAGHSGHLILGQLGGVHVAVLQGRFHLYEGYSPAQVVLPTRTLRQLGAEILVVTNAAGGLDPAQHAGDLMLVKDHIGLPTMTGLSPLQGPNDDQLGPRFPAMAGAYDPDLRATARQVAQDNGIELKEGVYAMVTGPTFETPAEVRFLRTIGADAVGMSTVPEVIAARHLGMRVLAFSCLTNIALGEENIIPSESGHADVLAVAVQAGYKLATLITGVLERISS